MADSLEPMRVCRHCGQALPLTAYEHYPSGHHRRICRRCHTELHSRPAKERWRKRHLATVVAKR